MTWTPDWRNSAAVPACTAASHSVKLSPPNVGLGHVTDSRCQKHTIYTLTKTAWRHGFFKCQVKRWNGHLRAFGGTRSIPGARGPDQFHAYSFSGKREVSKKNADSVAPPASLPMPTTRVKSMRSRNDLPPIITKILKKWVPPTYTVWWQDFLSVDPVIFGSSGTRSASGVGLEASDPASLKFRTLHTDLRLRVDPYKVVKVVFRR